MAPERSAEKKWKEFFMRPFRKASSTKGRPTTDVSDPFLSKDYVRAQDLQRLQDVRNRNRPANVPSKPSSSQDPRQHRNTGFQAGIETSAARMGDPTGQSRRRREQGTKLYHVAPPTAAYLSDPRTPPREQGTTPYPFAPPTRVPSKPSSSQDPRQHRNTSFQAGIETSAARMGDPTGQSRRRREQGTKLYPVAPPTAAYLSDPRTPRREQGTRPHPVAPPTRAPLGGARKGRQEQKPSWPFPSSAQIAPANPADSYDEPIRSRALAQAQDRERQRERELAFANITPPICNVRTHRVQLNRPPERRSVPVQLSTPTPVQVHSPPPSSTPSTRSDTTRLGDFIRPPSPRPQNPPALTRRGAIRNPIPPRVFARQPVAPPPTPVPLPLCRFCQTRPISGPSSTYCAYCTSLAFYAEDYPRESTYPTRTPYLGPPAAAYLRDSNPRRAPQPPAQPQGRTPLRAQSQSQRPGSRTHIDPQTQPLTAKNPPRTQSVRDPQRHQRQRLAPNPASPTDESHIHPALRRSFRYFPASPDPSFRSFVPGDDGMLAGRGQERRGAVSGDQEVEGRGLWGLPLWEGPEGEEFVGARAGWGKWVRKG